MKYILLSFLIANIFATCMLWGYFKEYREHSQKMKKHKEDEDKKLTNGR